MRDDHGLAAGEADTAQVKLRRRKWPRALAGVVAWVLLFAGALMLLAPDILEVSYRISADDRMAAVDKVADQAADEASSAASDELASSTDQETAEAARRAADSLPWLQRYNEQVRLGMGAAVGDPFGLDASEGSLSSAGLSDTPVGRICVPAMDCDLPLYLGASQEHLALGAGVVSGTSAPIGEADSNLSLIHI